MCTNSLIELLPQSANQFEDRPLRLTNATGSVSLDLTSQRAWLVLNGEPQKELELGQVHGVLAVHFAEDRSAS